MSDTTEKMNLFGQQFGPYHVGKKIGEGGYAVVFRGTEVELERDVALKVLKPNHKNEYGENVKKRFMREARMVASLKNQHTVQLYGHGEHEGLLYLAFEYVEGETLAAYLRREGALKPLQVVKLLEQILEGLEEAHDRGLVHRDIKPANIMVFAHNRRGLQAKVLDFGIGKFVREQQKITQLTAEGLFIGTPRYMSPEQMKQAENLGPGVDIWAVGMIAYELLVGERAITTNDLMAMTTRVMDASPFTLPTNLGVPLFLRDIVEKMLKKDVNRRYKSASEILRDLEDFRMRASHDSGLQNISALQASAETDFFMEGTEERTPGEIPSQRVISVPPSIPESEISLGQQKSKDRNNRKLWAGGLILISLLGVAWIAGRPSLSTNAEVPAFLLEQETPAKLVPEIRPVVVTSLAGLEAQKVVWNASSAAKAESSKAADIARDSVLTAKVKVAPAPPKPAKIQPSVEKLARPEEELNSVARDNAIETVEDEVEVPKEESPKLRLWGIQ